MSRRQDWTDSKKWRELDMKIKNMFKLQIKLQKHKIFVQ